MKQTDAYHGPSHGPVKAALMSLVRPVSAVRRADHLPLWHTWGVHAAGMGCFWFAIWVLAALESMRYEVGVAEAILLLPDEMAELAGEFIEELDQVWMWIALFFMGLFTELSFVLAGLVAMSWGARDEPWRFSYSRALRRMWLLTPHAGTVTLLCGVAIGWIDWYYWDHYDTLGAQYILSTAVFGTGSLWSLWVFLAALGCRKPASVCRWPAGCMHCGYQLTGIGHDQTCPECGHAIKDTLSKQTRPGIAGPGWLLWWIKTSYSAVRRPAELGKTIHVLSPDNGHRRCLAISIVGIMLISPVAMGIIFLTMRLIQLYTHNYDYFSVEDTIQVMLVAGNSIGLAMTASLVGLALLSATVIGLIDGWRVRRNLMPAAVRAAGYQSGFVLLWAVVFWANLVPFVAAIELDMLTRVAIRFDVDMELLIFVWQGGLLLLGVTIYAALIAKATRAAMHANW